jgi:NTE family protein
LRYDDQHKLVAAVGMQVNNLPWPGLRLEHELQFAGLTRYLARASYPSRTLSLPLYPFLELRYKDVPTDAYGPQGERLATFDDGSMAIEGGIGFQLFKTLNSELTYGREVVDVTSRVPVPNSQLLAHADAHLNLLRASLDVDALDDIFVPTGGFRLRAGWEGSYRRLHSDLEYEVWRLSADLYHTLGRRHTLRLYSTWSHGRGDLPLYKQSNIAIPWEFVGLAYDQLRGDRLALGRAEYRHRWKRDIFLKLIANAAFDCRCAPLGRLEPGAVLWGWGAGLQLLSPAGPVEVIVARGSAGFGSPRRYQNRVYVTIGCRF